MKTLVLSDIHGNASALETVLALPLTYDLLIVVGDTLYHGPRNPILDGYNPSKVSELLNDLSCPVLAVRGNCDAEVDQMLLKFPTMQDYTITSINNKLITVSHGHLFDPDNHALDTKCDIYITGHTHLPILENKGNYVMLNPGSISLPKGDHPATFAFIDNEDINIYTLDMKSYMSLKL